MADKLIVNQDDREATAQLIETWGGHAFSAGHHHQTRKGAADESAIVQAFAAHRLKAEASLDQMRERVKVLEGALGFYARENSWRSSSVHMCGHSGDSSATLDRGNKARQALSEQPISKEDRT